MEATAGAIARRNSPECKGCLRPALDTLLEGCQFIGFDWKYIYVNPAAARHGRRDCSDLMGRSLFECYPGIEKTRAFAALKHCMDTRAPVRLETEFAHFNEIAAYELSVQPIAEGICVLSNEISERKCLERDLLRVIDSEQARIGQDLHDGIGQCLVAIEFRLSALAQRLGGSDETFASEAREIGAMIRDALAQTRKVARGLSSLADGPEGLGNALEELARATRQIFGVECEAVKCGAPGLIEHGVATHLFRIAQEAINNAVRHAKAKKIDVQLEEGIGQVTLTVKDDGAGLPKLVAPGLGLRTMRYRADSMHGALVVRNREVGGVEVICTVTKRNASAPGRTPPGRLDIFGYEI